MLNAMCAAGEDTDSFRLIEWDLAQYTGELLRVRAYDLSSGVRGMIALDAVNITGCLDQSPNAPPEPSDNWRPESTIDGNRTLNGSAFTVHSDSLWLVYDLQKEMYLDQMRVYGSTTTALAAAAKLYSSATPRGPWTLAVDSFNIAAAYNWSTSARCDFVAPLLLLLSFVAVPVLLVCIMGDHSHDRNMIVAVFDITIACIV